MKNAPLVCLYDRLAVWERIPLILAAGARGDETEARRLLESAPLLASQFPEHLPAEIGLRTLARAVRLRTARRRRAVFFCDVAGRRRRLAPRGMVALGQRLRLSVRRQRRRLAAILRGTGYRLSRFEWRRFFAKLVFALLRRTHAQECAQRRNVAGSKPSGGPGRESSADSGRSAGPLA